MADSPEVEFKIIDDFPVRVPKKKRSLQYIDEDDELEDLDIESETQVTIDTTPVRESVAMQQKSNPNERSHKEEYTLQEVIYLKKFCKN